MMGLILTLMFTGATRADVSTRTALLTRQQWFNVQQNECHAQYLNALGSETARQQVLLTCVKEIFRRQNELYPALSSNEVDGLRSSLLASWATLTKTDAGRAALVRAEIGALNERFVKVAGASSAATASN